MSANVQEISFQETLKAKINSKTKPLGALGHLESLALQIGVVQGTLSPVIRQPTHIVFAGDHGIVAEGVSAYPQAVTYQMVLNFLTGGAAVNVFARQHGLALKIVDAGVNHDFAPHPELVDAKIALGTRNFLYEPAMSKIECRQALYIGADLVSEIAGRGSNVISFGEMGIGNTAASSILMSILCELPLEQCVGRGTGLDDDGVSRKTEILRQAIQAHPKLDPQDIISVLATFGGFEIAMMAGAMQQAYRQGMLILVDGFVSGAALLVALRLEPDLLSHCVFAHLSDESGHRDMLWYLGVQPLLQLGMRLGEGTGAVLAYPLVQSAVAFLNEMASFESAQISGKKI